MNFAGKLALFSVLVLVSSGNLPGICEETGRPASVRSRPQGMEARNEPDKNVGAWFASVYRDHISRVDSDRCPSIPSCSSYSARAFKKHGFFMGWLMTVDRLIHEGDEGSVSPVVYHKGRFKILDPVENNDFWWFCEDESTQK
ncbi:MAG: membrane protein insertion efficiency factor YidD [Deltaproteobacteria bacterium]|nr:membrane protein insertion efficiency factor YidD [Deltaproteobacteria bacterium]